MKGEWQSTRDFCGVVLENGETWKFGTAQWGPTIAAAHNAALQRAVEEERAACTMVAAGEPTWVEADSYLAQTDMRRRIADAIRARGQAVAALVEEATDGC